MTTTATTATQTREAPALTATWRDRAGKVILGLCAAGALIANAATVSQVANANGTLRVAETWRMAGLPVFAGLFLILAGAPRRVAGLWEVVIANKIALVVAGATYLSGVDGGSDFVYVDGALVALLVAAYTLTRGWTAWSHR